MKTHSSAFNGLLSLIPAKYYYDDATQDQWQQKKKSKQELKQNKRAKLDPNSKEAADSYTNAHASAKDVMDNKAKNAPKVSLPKKLPASITEDSDDDVNMEVTNEEDEDEDEVDNENDNEDSEQIDDPLMYKKSQITFDEDNIDANDGVEFSKQVAQQQKRKKTLSPEEQRKKDENLAKLREKLSSKINTMKERRKAPGTKVAGAPKSREQILEERKKKAELRKRKREEMENEASDDDLSDSEGEDDEDDDEEEEEQGSEVAVQDGDSSVLYGNIVFNDGTRLTSDLGKMRSTMEKKSKKGPSNNDVKAHLKILENRKRVLEQMTPEEQIKQKEKDKWTRVMAQAEGAKIKDDEKLLKKALKRKERQKLKSEIEWKDRKQMVKDTKAARQKRRDENLKARRENKGKKSKNQPRLKKFVGTVHKKRAGFEGSSKSKGGRLQK